MNHRGYIFQDEGGSRWTKLRFTLFIALALLFTASLVFIRSLLIEPKLKALAGVKDLSTRLQALITAEQKNHVPISPPSWLLKTKGTSAQLREQEISNTDQQIRLGFYVKWDSNSYESLRDNASKLTHISPETFVISDMPPRLVTHSDAVLDDLLPQTNLKLIPMLTNLLEDRWQPEAIEALLRDTPDKQKELFSAIISHLQEMNASGVLIDWEQLDPTYSRELTSTLSLFKGLLKEKGMQLWLCVPVGNDIKIFDLDALALVVDHFVAMLYDETGDSDAPGPISSLDWYQEWMDALLIHGNSRQWIVGLGSYGYDWSENQKTDTVSFAEVMTRASYTNTGTITNNRPFDGLHFDFQDRAQSHTVWFLDAISFRNQKAIAETKSVGGIALWRLGLEDPAVWEALNCINTCEPSQFQNLNSNFTLTSMGNGDFLTLSKIRASGLRTIHQDSSGMWSVAYKHYPRFPLVYHQGESNIDQVSLTFDDGPDRTWTPLILDILKEKAVPATFFITGSSATSNPSLVRRIAEEGHLLGNHTYSHGNLGLMSEARIELELNSTQLLIQSITDKSTILFRPPYNADRNPQNMREFSTLFAAQKLGYLPVSASIDVKDWDDPTTENILSRLKAARNEGNVILMHDGGGDRSATVEALPQIIDYLRMRGDDFVPLNRLLNLAPSALMPPIQGDEVVPQQGIQPRFIAMTGFSLLYIGEELLWAFMILSTAIVFFRTLLVLTLALIHRRAEKRVATPCQLGCPPVSVLIAAYNEEKVIRATLNSVLQSDYAGLMEVLVIDDGSKDSTAQIVAEIASQDSRVVLYSQKNTGKAAALSFALSSSTFEHIVMLDADTQFQRSTISELMAVLDRPEMGAVSGHAKVGNLRRVIGRFQSLEYTCGFNLDRRAYDVWNCITVVPGAVSAFKRSAIVAAGGISEDTLAEDTDLTLNLHRQNYKVGYAAKAIAWTEAPETVGALLRQRKRWAFGTLQCLWKHRDLVFNPQYRALGFLSIPSVWFCHMFLVALIPLVDFLLVLSLFTGQGSMIFEYALVFLLLDLFLAFSACLMEKQSVKSAWLILPMRFLYRPLLAWAVWSSIVRALRGAWVGWGKQERRGSVTRAVFTESEALTKAVL